MAAGGVLPEEEPPDMTDEERMRREGVGVDAVPVFIF